MVPQLALVTSYSQQSAGVAIELGSISSIKSEVYFFQWLTAYMILPVFNHQCWLPVWLLWLCGGACTVGCWAVWGWLRWCWWLGCLWGCVVMQQKSKVTYTSQASIMVVLV